MGKTIDNRTYCPSNEDDLISEGHHSTCFICTTSLVSLIDHQEVREYSIRTVFRHLKINQEIQRNSNNSQSVDLVPFCERCYPIFKTLSSYCDDLEILTMRISYFLKELNKLTVEDDDVKQKCEFITKARMQLKRKLKTKCASNDRTSPIVILTQLEDNSERCSDDEYEPEVYDTVETSDDQYDSSGSESKSSQPSRKQLRKIKASNSSIGNKSSSPRSRRKFHCLECRHEFSHKHHFLDHSFLFHPEKYFPANIKSDNVTQQQFKMYLNHLLNTEVNSCASIESGFKCAYCINTYKKDNKRHFRIHLTKIHRDKLSKKLVQLQKELPVDEVSILAELQRHKKHPVYKLQKFCKKKRTEYTCSICQVRNTSQRKHEAIYHPEKFLLSSRLEKISLEHFKMYCLHVINKQMENFTKTLENNSQRYKCPYCPNSYADLQGSRNHLIFKHLPLLSVEIGKLQQTIEPHELELSQSEWYMSTDKPVQILTTNCKICDVRLTEKGLAIHMRKNHPKEYFKKNYLFMCEICKKKFSSKWGVDHHKSMFHAEKLLENCKAPVITVEQFKIYCEFMIRTEIGSLVRVSTSSDGTIRYGCRYCTKTFKKEKYSQVHLLTNHLEILGGKLEELQKTITVDEIKQDMVTRGEKSRKVSEEDDGFEATEVFCDKGVAKRELNDTWDINDGEMVADFDDLDEFGLENADFGIEEESECKINGEVILPD